MKINGLETVISSYTAETLNKEMVLYNEETQKIIYLNHTAMIVWEEIIECFKSNTDISTNDIVEIINQYYNISESDLDAIRSDVEETLEMLFKSSLLKKV